METTAYRPSKESRALDSDRSASHSSTADYIRARARRADLPQDDLALVKKAYDFSLKYHEGQTRASGEPYLVHPLEVALVLAEMKMDPVAVAAGLLPMGWWVIRRRTNPR